MADNPKPVDHWAVLAEMAAQAEHAWRLSFGNGDDPDALRKRADALAFALTLREAAEQLSQAKKEALTWRDAALLAAREHEAERAKAEAALEALRRHECSPKTPS